MLGPWPIRLVHAPKISQASNGFKRPYSGLLHLWRCTGLSLACGCSWMFQGETRCAENCRKVSYSCSILQCLQSSECSARTKLQMRSGTWRILAAFDHSIGTFEPAVTAVPKARSSTEQRLPDVECRRVSSLVVAWLSSVVEVMRIVSGLCLDCVS